MTYKPNPRQLVLRRDTATGLTLVGWASDLPIGRFEHLELIGESANNSLPNSASDYYAAYHAALQTAREANTLLLEQKIRHHQSQGWYRVPFDLASNRQALQADSVGNYAAAAMQLHYQLTQNRRQAWAILRHGTIVHVRARHPEARLDELTYQVWYHQQQQQLNELGGMKLEGDLMTCESGLWFMVK